MISGIPIAHKAKKGVITSLEEINLDINIPFRDKIIIKNAVKECLDSIVTNYFYNEGNYGRTYKTVPTKHLVEKMRDGSELDHKPHYLKQTIKLYLTNLSENLDKYSGSLF